MNPCEPFIRRPVATSLLMLAVFIIGVIGYSFGNHKLYPRTGLDFVFP